MTIEQRLVYAYRPLLALPPNWLVRSDYRHAQRRARTFGLEGRYASLHCEQVYLNAIGFKELLPASPPEAV